MLVLWEKYYVFAMFCHTALLFTTALWENRNLMDKEGIDFVQLKMIDLSLLLLKIQSLSES